MGTLDDSANLIGVTQDAEEEGVEERLHTESQERGSEDEEAGVDSLEPNVGTEPTDNHDSVEYEACDHDESR